MSSSSKSLTINEMVEILKKLDIRYIICEDLIYCIYYCNGNIYSTALFILYSIETNNINCTVNIKFINNCSKELKMSITHYIENIVKKDKRRIFSPSFIPYATEKEVDEFNKIFISKISTRINDVEYIEDFLRIIDSSKAAIEDLKKPELNVIELLIRNLNEIQNMYNIQMFEKLKDSYVEEHIDRMLNDLNIQKTYMLHSILILIEDPFFLKALKKRNDYDEFCKILSDEMLEKEYIGNLMSKEFAEKILRML